MRSSNQRIFVGIALAVGCGGQPADPYDGAFGDTDAGEPTADGSPSPDDDGETEDGGADGGDAKFDVGDMPDVPEEGDPIIPETCDQASEGLSTVGCRFYAVDMDSADGVEDNQYAVAIANVHLSQDAEVVIERKVANAWEPVAGPHVIAALDLHTFELPDQHTDDTQLRVGGAYRITADVPVIAYQFNPVDGSAGYLSDASMLYPAPALDTINHVAGRESTLDAVFQQKRNGYATVVATRDGTEVVITPSVATMAGAGIAATAAGVPLVLQLDEGDVASVATAELNASMTGTKIEGNEPVAVFSGHECANIPDPTCCCDHLEEQIAGVRQWGKKFAASRMPVRNLGNPEPTVWQLYASEDGTTIETDAGPDVTGLPGAPIVLDKGESIDLTVAGPPGAAGDFIVTADKPIGVFSYMVGSQTMSAPLDETGDPAMVQLGPVEQFLPRYVVLVPNTWDNDVLVITREAGSVVTVDGMTVSDAEFTPVADGEYEVARVPTADGVHVLDGGSAAFGVVVVGYDQWDSYAYLGGTGTGVINPDPAG